MSKIVRLKCSDIIELYNRKNQEVKDLNNIIDIVYKKLKYISITSSAYNYQCAIDEVITMIEVFKGSDKNV